MTTKRTKTTSRKNGKSRRRKRTRKPSAPDPDFPEPTFEPDPAKPNAYRIGRPPLDIDPRQVFRIAQCHSTMEEIAFIVGCSVDTLANRFSDVIKLARTHEDVSTRRLQFAIAHGSLARFGDKRKLRGPNAEMAKWLGKQYLGQRDRVLVQNQDIQPIVETYLPENGRPMIVTGDDTQPVADLGPPVDSNSDSIE